VAIRSHSCDTARAALDQAGPYPTHRLNLNQAEGLLLAQVPRRWTKCESHNQLVARTDIVLSSLIDEYFGDSGAASEIN
jgi:hypothetical protein